VNAFNVTDAVATLEVGGRIRRHTVALHCLSNDGLLFLAFPAMCLEDLASRLKRQGRSVRTCTVLRSV
jgi:hypothetical protein